MTFTEARIVAREPIGVPHKSAVGKGTKWYATVRYTLEDGTTIESSVGPYSTRKAAVAANVARDGITNMTANYADGRFFSTTTRYGFGVA